MKFRHIILFILLVAIFSCNKKAKYPYSISDFSENIQPYLISIVNESAINNESRGLFHAIDSLTSDKDLLKLTECEHPLIRSAALDIASVRKTLNSFSVMMNHLDDTAKVNWYFQCATYEYTNVSDYMIESFSWDNKALKKQTIYKIIEEHNYLLEAYNALSKIKLTDKEYPMVKKMAEREYPIKVRAKALYALASYKKKADINFIKTILDKERHFVNKDCFDLIKDFPDTNYYSFMIYYANKRFAKDYCWFDGSRTPVAESFINALVSYKNKQSAIILDTILRSKRIAKFACSKQFIEYTYCTLSENECPAYTKMLPIARAIKKENDKFILHVDIPQDIEIPKKIEKKVIWFGD